MAQVQAPLPGFPTEPPEIMKTVSSYPRLRYMGSKYRIMPYLVSTFSSLDFTTALDAFSGSGVVAYALKVMGKEVTANDFLSFAATVARATVENTGVQLDPEEVQKIVGSPVDERSFIRDTFRGLYFPDEDHAFLDSAWSNIDQLEDYKRDLAISALCLAAARKQPRGVFTITDLRYDDGRRTLHTPLREQFQECVADYNAVVVTASQPCRAVCSDIFDIDPEGFDLIYMDPPYVPPRDDNDYIKRYHFLEGLSTYWRGQEIMYDTITKKLKKRYTPFSYKRTIGGALSELFHRFRSSTIVLSYNSKSIPSEQELYDLLRKSRPNATIEVVTIPHRYHFGTHKAARRREANEFIFVMK